MFLCSQPLLIMQGLQICGLRGQAGDAHKGPWRPQLPLVADRTQQLPARGKHRPRVLRDQVLLGEDGHLDFPLKSEEKHWQMKQNVSDVPTEPLWGRRLWGAGGGGRGAWHLDSSSFKPLVM